MDVAIVDDDGVLVAVTPVAPADWVTDLARRQIALPVGHDARAMIGRYRWDPIRQTFRLIS